jgi:alpha-1,2-mannosyltransferase
MPQAAPTGTSGAQPTADKPGRWRVAVWVLWLLPLLILAALVATRPDTRTVTPLYHAAVQHWGERQPLYNGPSGMNYLPHFVALFAPYHLLGRVAGDILWRCTAAVGLAAGLWLFCRSLPGKRPERSFVLVTLVVLPLCLGALRNGQANAHLGAVLLLAAWCLKEQRWWAAAALLWLAVVIKPLGLAAVGLAWAAYPRLWWRLALGLPVVALGPFLLGPVDYVWSQYTAALENLRRCSDIPGRKFADLNGLLRVLGLPLTGSTSLAARAAGGAGLMLLCWQAVRRQPELFRALLWLGLAAAYLMLFNPMTEANSYVILAPALGLMAWWHLGHGAPDLGRLLAVLALTMGLLPNLLHPVFGNSFALVWHPTMTLAFLTAMVWQLLRSTGEGTVPSQAAAASP